MSKIYPGRGFVVGAVGAGREGSGNKVLCAGGEIWVVYSLALGGLTTLKKVVWANWEHSGLQ